MAGVEGLEPPAPGFGDRYLRVIWGKMVAFRLHIARHLPPIPTQKLAQTCTTNLHETRIIFILSFHLSTKFAAKQVFDPSI